VISWPKHINLISYLKTKAEVIFTVTAKIITTTITNSIVIVTTITTTTATTTTTRFELTNLLFF